jgi:hypothetical protein
MCVWLDTAALLPESAALPKSRHRVTLDGGERTGAMLRTRPSNGPLELYGALCDCLDHATYTGLAWPKVDTLARRMKVASRTVQRALDDLREECWIGTPFGNAGGSREGVVHHLHPDGKPCLFCVAARTISQPAGRSRRTRRVTESRP